MAGRKGMQHSSVRTGTVRRKVWTSIRIFKRFTVPGIFHSIPGDVSFTNIRKFITSLERHGYVRKCAGYVGGRAGEFQQYQMIKDIGPDPPTVCDRCGASISASKCEKKEKEKEKETQKEKEKEKEEARAAGGER